MNRRGYKSPIPKTAREVVDKTYADANREVSSYFIGETKVGCRVWWDDGQTICLEYGLKNGQKHGNELYFRADGSLLSVEPYRNGRPHGKATQFAPDGSVLIEYFMGDGIGMDLWCRDNGSLSEEHYSPDDGELGHKRFWNEDNQSLWLEETWLNDSGWHGIRRQWNNKRHLCRGFPQYYVHGQRVTKRQYMRACEKDPSLPPFVPEQNQPFRTLPVEYLAQRQG